MAKVIVEFCGRHFPIQNVELDSNGRILPEYLSMARHQVLMMVSIYHGDTLLAKDPKPNSTPGYSVDEVHRALGIRKRKRR